MSISQESSHRDHGIESSTAYTLNPEQAAAVHHSGGPAIVLAGPGTGKTSVLTHRVRWLIEDQNVAPESILAVTFTNKAAGELRNRLAELLGSITIAQRVVATTFHSLGLRLIRRFADFAGWTAEPRLIDEAQQRAIMRHIIHETGLGISHWFYDPNAALPEALAFIGHAQNAAVNPQQALDHAAHWKQQIESGQANHDEESLQAQHARCDKFERHAILYQQFQEHLRRNGLVTFDDLQTMPIELLRASPPARAIVRSDYRHILVDEFQDANIAQIELLKQLASTQHDVMVVGDDDQSIYGFRGATQSAFHRFAQHWTKCAQITLTRNYRSTPVILAAADVIISGCEDRFASEKVTVAAGSNQSLTNPIITARYDGNDGAATAIGRCIQHHMGDGCAYSDFAVLTRTRNDADRIAAGLSLLGVPVDLPERNQTFQAPVVLDVLSWLRLLADPYDDVHLTRLLTRPPYSLELTHISQWHRRHAHQLQRELQQNESLESPPAPITFLDRLVADDAHEAIRRFHAVHSALAPIALTSPVDDLVRSIVQHARLITSDVPLDDDHEASLYQIAQFLSFISQRMGDLDPPRQVRQFLTWYDDLTNRDGSVPGSPDSHMEGGVEFASSDAVRILTAHSAKGLEFETVFIPRLNSPHGYPLSDKDANAEPLLPDGLGVEEKPNHDDEERRLFFVALTRARKNLVLLSQATDSARRNLKPCTYWNEIVEAQRDDVSCVSIEDAIQLDTHCDDHDESAVRTAELADEDGPVVHRRLIQTRHEIAALLDQLRDPCTPVDRLASLSDQLRSCAQRLPLLSNVSTERIDEYLAALPSEDRAAIEPLAQQIAKGATTRRDLPAPPRPPLTLSFSYINDYLRCPRCFWLKHVIRVPERSTKGLQFGSIFHRSVEFFYKALLQHSQTPDLIAPPTLEDLHRFGKDAYENMRDPEEPWIKDTQQRIFNMLTHFHTHMHEDSANPVEIESLIVFQYECDGHTHEFSAKLDRIDADETGHHVIDYKTGNPTKSRLEPATSDLQLGIYYLALQHHLRDPEPAGSAQYWLTQTGEKGVLPFEKIKIANVRKKIDKAIHGIVDGVWDPASNCDRCAFYGFDPI